MNEFEELFEKIYQGYRDSKKSEKIVRLTEKIAAGGGTYKDLYEFASNLGDDLGKIITENLSDGIFTEKREELQEQAGRFLEILKKYGSDISDQADQVQKALNRAIGIGLKPQRVSMDQEAAERIVEKITGLQLGGIPKAVENYGMKTVDRTVRSNADFLSRTGFSLKVVREYDNVGVHTDRKPEICRWCSERAGIYDYLEVKQKGSPVWQRHEGCGCSIEFYNENGKRETVNNFVKMSRRGEKTLTHERNREIKKVQTLNEYIVDGVKYVVDGRYVIQKTSESEKRIAEALAEYFDKKVELVPRILYPQGIKTPDYLIGGAKYDLKEIGSKNKDAIYNAIHKKKGQSSKFVIDFSKSELSIADFEMQIAKIFKSEHTKFVKEIVLSKNGKVIGVYKPK